MATVIIAGAGSGQRAGFNKNKLLVENNGLTVIEQTFRAFSKNADIKQFIITASKDDLETYKRLFQDKALIVEGGLTRTQSVKKALEFVSEEVVLIHDGARPFVTNAMIDECIKTADKYGSAIPLCPISDTVAKSDGRVVDEYKGKANLYAVQTPQGFKTDLIKSAYAFAKEVSFNDDGEVYKNLYGTLSAYDGDANNIKLTYKEDFERLKKINEVRVGVGFDCHRLVENRKLILGGIEIPHDKGLLGHSDADVLTHAIMDAILSAISERDIGYHFPDNDPAYKNADSMKLLDRVLDIVNDKGYRVSGVTATVMAEKPKLLPHIPTITESLSKALSLDKDRVGIAATTLEGLGFVGREEGICVHANATVIKKA